MSEKRKRQRKKDEEELSFEQSLERLEEIAARLESEDVPLQEAIALAEEGLRLSAFCEKQLKEAEGKIEQLVERMGALGTEPVQTEGGENEQEE